jgi:hypothetical protein
VLLASVVLVPSVQFSLRARGFGWTAQRLASWSDVERVDARILEAQAAADAVAIVAGRRLVGARCLGRSLVLWFLLRRRGVDARVVVGAQAVDAGTLPAHAWVEVDGVPVNDATDVGERFGSFGVSLPRLRAR